MRNCDILIAGGGLAGTAAAIAAARRGHDVLLIEASNCLGGAACTCLVNPFMPYTTEDDAGGTVFLSAGIFAEIVDRLNDLTRTFDGEDSAVLGVPAATFSEEYLKILLNRMASEAGVRLLFHTQVVSAEREQNRITSAVISNIDGLTEVSAKYNIDCTGDAVLSAASGFPTRLGRPGDSLCQPMTLCFRVGGIDRETFRQNYHLMQDKYRSLRAAGVIKNPRENVLLFSTLLDSVVHFNTTRIVKRNPVNADEVTAAEIEAREQVAEMLLFLRQHVPGCEHTVLLSTAMEIGKRESRMIDGEYLLTQDDLLAFRHFDDGIAACNYDIDIHNPEGSGTSHHYFPKGKYYTIPYRCLIPKNADNLLTAGRCISVTHEAQASCRIMPTVTTLGQAAGAAAALALEENCSVRTVDTELLRSVLSEAGAFLG